MRSHISDDSEILRAFEKLSKNLVFNDWKIGTAPGDEIFDSVIRSLVYFPLIVNDELVGMFAGKSRNAGFFPEDVQSLATFSNQLANVVKTRILISEQKKE